MVSSVCCCAATRIVGEGGSVDEIVAAMPDGHADCDNPRTLWHSARVAVAKRGQPARAWSCRSCTPVTQSQPSAADGPTRGSLGALAVAHGLHVRPALVDLGAYLISSAGGSARLYKRPA